MLFNLDKCKVMRLDYNNPKVNYVMEATRLQEVSEEEWDLGIITQSLPQTEMVTCVVFPDPVSPTNTRHWFLFNVSINLSLYSQTGSVVRFLYNSQYFGENGNPTSICQACSLQFTESTFKEKKIKITIPHLDINKILF